MSQPKPQPAQVERDWMASARCLNDLAWLDRDHEAKVAECTQCPVAAPCLALGLDVARCCTDLDASIVYGGRAAGELRALARRQRRKQVA